MHPIARLAAGAACVALLALAGCGDDSEPRPVALVVHGPADGAVVRDGRIAVSGRVRPPQARVLVLGRAATVSHGRFRALVPLRVGSNVIDVGAFADGAAPTWTAVRVERQLLVDVPDLTGAPRQEAVDRLEEAGLRAEVHEEGGLLDELLGGEWTVCGTAPGAGARVGMGTVVEVTVSRAC
jgi:hypothetical protein